jgi:hypothetical protein
VCAIHIARWGPLQRRSLLTTDGSLPMEGLYILMHSTLLSNNNCLRLHAASSAIVNKYWTYASDNVEAEKCFYFIICKRVWHLLHIWSCWLVEVFW